MDYNRGEELDIDWTDLSRGPQSDGHIYERLNPFETLPAASRAQLSTESRYGLDNYSQDTMAWSQHQGRFTLLINNALLTLTPASYHSHAPSLHLSPDEDAELDMLDRTYSYSNLGSPAFDQTSFLSVSPHQTPGESSSKRTSYFQGPARSISGGSDEPSHSSTTARKKERAQHNVVEHRYREKLNSQICHLKDKVPALREASHTKKGGKESAKVGKSTVLVKAGEYIEKLESDNARLRKRNESLERLVQRLVHGRASGSSGFDMTELNLS